MKNFWKFVKTSGIYFVGTVLQKLITFFLLPIYTAYISPKDMGTYDAAIAYITFLCSVLFLDIWSGIMRFTFEYEGEERKKPINSGLAIFGCSAVLYTVIMVAAGCIFHVQYLPFMYFYGLLMNMQNLMGYLARTYQKNTLYTASGLLSSFTTVIFNIIFIVLLKMDYSALFISGCIGYLLNICILGYGIRFHRLISYRDFQPMLFKRLFLFSVPLCMNSVAYWFLTSYNRVAITGVLGADANGMYSIAGRFASFITLFTTCFNMAWQEMSYSREASADGDKESFYTGALNSYIKFLGMGIAVLIPAIYVIFPVMINEAYAPARVLVPYYLLGTLASSVSAFLGNIFTAIKKNNILFYTTVIGSVVNVTLVHLLLPRVGVQGASMALFTGFFINIVIRIRVLMKEIKVHMDWKFLGAYLIWMVIVVWIYNTQGIVLNIAAVFLGILLTVFVFKDMLCQIIASIKEKMSKKTVRK
ncbi:MAG: lipopolysaccharide biosynthesis protein [Blautia sp.]